MQVVVDYERAGGVAVGLLFKLSETSVVGTAADVYAMTEVDVDGAIRVNLPVDLDVVAIIVPCRGELFSEDGKRDDGVESDVVRTKALTACAPQKVVLGMLPMAR